AVLSSERQSGEAGRDGDGRARHRRSAAGAAAASAAGGRRRPFPAARWRVDRARRPSYSSARQGGGGRRAQRAGRPFDVRARFPRRAGAHRHRRRADAYRLDAQAGDGRSGGAMRQPGETMLWTAAFSGSLAVHAVLAAALVLTPRPEGGSRRETVITIQSTPQIEVERTEIAVPPALAVAPDSVSVAA